MEKAQNRGGGGAGYLFEISRSSEVLTRDCTAIAGRHNFIQNWDFGASGLVWLRCVSQEGRGFSNSRDRRGYSGLSEYHHSLAMACLVDSCTLDDGWFGGNRHDWGAGAGNTVTQSVYWNTRGEGVLRPGRRAAATSSERGISTWRLRCQAVMLRARGRRTALRE